MLSEAVSPDPFVTLRKGAWRDYTHTHVLYHAGLGSITNWQLQLQYQLQAKHNYHLQLQLHQGGFQLCN